MYCIPRDGKCNIFTKKKKASNKLNSSIDFKYKRKLRHCRIFSNK